MGNKKTSKEIRKVILKKLRDGPDSISEISESIGSNWLTTEQHIGELIKNHEVVEVLSSPKMKIYRRTDDPVYYSLPFSKEVRDNTIYLLSKIIELWKEKNKEYPNKTTTQKIAVEVIEKCNLNLPILEFHYGKVTCMNIDSNSNLMNTYEIISPTNYKDILNCIKERIGDKSHSGKSYDERILQYRNKGMDFYITKEELVKSFKGDKFQEIEKKIFDLSMNFPMKLDYFYSKFNDFVSTSTTLLSLESEEEDNLEKIKETFFSLWALLTTASYFIDASNFIPQNKKEVFGQIKRIGLNFKSIGYEDLITELQSELVNINFENIKMPEGDESKEIQKLIRESLD